MSSFARARDWVHWCTPAPVWRAVAEALGGIDLDPCSNPRSSVQAYRRVSLPEDGLAVDWARYRSVYVNPPYGRGIGAWTGRASWSYLTTRGIPRDAGSAVRATSRHDPQQRIVLLLPVAPSSAWFRDLLSVRDARLVLMHRRLAFEGGPCAHESCGLPPGEHPGVGHAYVEPRSSPSMQSCMVVLSHDGKVAANISAELARAGYPATVLQR